MTGFLVVKAPSSYNIILEHLTLSNLKALTFTYHLNMKFQLEVEVRVVWGEQV